MKFSAVLALLPLVAAIPASMRAAEDMSITINVKFDGQTQRPAQTLTLDPEYPVCDDTCPEGVWIPIHPSI